MGSNREAFQAGPKPNRTPIVVETATAATIDGGEVSEGLCRRTEGAVPCPARSTEVAAGTRWPSQRSEVLRRRMPADGNPAAPSFDDQRVVHVQGAFGGSADGSDPDDLGAVHAPAEVIIPALPPRVEQRHHLPGHGVW